MLDGTGHGEDAGDRRGRPLPEAVAEDQAGQVGDLAELPPLTGWITHQSVLSALEPPTARR
ncbi:hypothetical protein DMP23_17745 [Amycolatopsis sp. A1MSW2902]